MTKISLRIEQDLLEFIDRYGSMNGLDRTKSIKQLLKAGATNVANMGLVQKFQDNLNNRWIEMSDKSTKLINEGKNLIMVRDMFMCQKCHNHDNLDVYNIDRNPLNTNPTNLITLCNGCISKVQKYAPQRRVYEDFVEWFFLL
jgi:hypothetical protein